MMKRSPGRCATGLAGLLVAAPGMAQAAASPAGVSIERVEMTPTRDGFYDATVAIQVRDARLGEQGKINFAISIAHVHDVDEAINKTHDPLKMLSEDLRQGYFDLHREP